MSAKYIGLTMFGLALAVRLYGLGAVLTADEPQWIFRAQSFFKALQRGDPGGTFQGTHPGVVPMLLMGSGIRGLELAAGTILESPTVGPFRYAAKLPIAAAVSVAIGTAAALAGLLWGPFTGIAAGVVLALEPFLVGHSQLAHVDALLALLMLLAILTLLYFVRTNTFRMLILSGVLGGLALLTKIPAVFLFLPVACTVVLWRNSWSSALRCLLLWSLTAAFTFFLLWPSLWQHTVPNTRYAARDIRTVVTTPHVGEAAESAGHAPLFYARALVTRTNPLSLLLAVGGSILLLRSGMRDRRREAFVLILFVVGFLLLLTLVEKKADRYLLPSLAGVDVLAGVALGRLLARKKLRTLTFSTATFGLLLLDLTVRPYAIAYRSPFSLAEEPTQSGWGEGLEQAARMLNTHPLASEFHAASWYPAVFSEFFRGKTTSLSSRGDPRVAYVVLYRNMRGRSPDSAATGILEEFSGEKPAAVVRVLGVEMAWIYSTHSVRLFPQNVGEIIGEKLAAEAKHPGTIVEAGQFIHPTGNNLSGIRLVFSTFSSRENTGAVIVHLRENPDGADLRTVSLDADTLEDNQWRDIPFDPLPDSRGRQYYLAVTSPTGRPGSAVTVNYQPKDILQGSPVFLRSPLKPGQRREDFRREGDLAYELLYEDAR